MLSTLHALQKSRSTPAERGLAAVSRAVRAVPAGLDAVIMAPFRGLENRRLLDAMAPMSDHDLRDIGLTRGDLRDASAVPAGQDAGLFLAARRDARRRSR